MINVYVASSWGNAFYSQLISELKKIYEINILDWRNPKPGDNGFHWKEIDPFWEEWTPACYREMLKHKLAEDGFNSDLRMMNEADICVLLLPCGKSAHLEAGWFIGKGKPVFILLENISRIQPELMYKLATHICLTVPELKEKLKGWKK